MKSLLYFHFLMPECTTIKTFFLLLVCELNLFCVTVLYRNYLYSSIANLDIRFAWTQYIGSLTFVNNYFIIFKNKVFLYFLFFYRERGSVDTFFLTIEEAYRSRNNPEISKPFKNKFCAFYKVYINGNSSDIYI